MATSIGIAAAKKRTSIYFIKYRDLLQNLKQVKVEERFETLYEL
ncbi:Insertion sequence IS232 putative ATP-binding protein [Bacillus thuringiensis serovar pakistani str. T13001]|nr:Insertion sequence IS232 putative ATP-binding protein [Bacillus thuringiensis serovar pakistani str. T13001]